MKGAPKGAKGALFFLRSLRSLRAPFGHYTLLAPAGSGKGDLLSFERVAVQRQHTDGKWISCSSPV